ncbi:MAG: Phosphate transporter, periplasmic phosphate-binding protein PstS [Acidobacteria bacterium]|jgi:phosphate transport system substrate-binding protein|nr:Phosphate transporter, periplasmic phosphate-binding protein PstS [Acidobacteriota bacterium]
MKSTLTIASLVFALLLVAGCGGGSGPSAKVVTIKGSDTMVILAQRWAEIYMGLHADVSIQVTGGGSGTGIAALINGGTDICAASRPMKDKEKEQVRSRRGKEVVETPVALDGVAIYVHQTSHLQSITQAQLKGIYTGKMTNWRDVGGEDTRIVAYSRENNSGTYVFFKEHVLNNEDFARDMQTLPGTAAVVNAVSKDPASVGYGGIAYATTIRTLPVRRDDSSAPVQPSLETVQSGEYPLSRNLYFYTAGEPSGEAKAFIDWVLSQEGQKICEAVGFYPLKQK